MGRLGVGGVYEGMAEGDLKDSREFGEMEKFVG